MDFSGINLPDLTPRIDTSFIDEMNRQNQEMIDSITPLNEILAEEIKPILEGNQKVVEGLNDNYNNRLCRLLIHSAGGILPRSQNGFQCIFGNLFCLIAANASSCQNGIHSVIV